MNIILFDHPEIRRSLLPLTFTRPVGDIRVGIMTIAEKWAHDLGATTSFLPHGYLAQKFPPKTHSDNFYINGAVCPDPSLIRVVNDLAPGQALVYQDMLIACRYEAVEHNEDLFSLKLSSTEYREELTLFKQTWQLFLYNGLEIIKDFKRLTYQRTSEKIRDPYTVVYSPENLFVEPGASIKAAIINAESGPVYIGKDTEVQEGTIIQGPFALCHQAQLRLGGKMRPNTTIGPGSKVGGEVGNVIFQSYSNKAHEGFLGNSVIGSWCNLGADTNNSNLKNNYSSVQVWDYAKQGPVDTGMQFCGTVMGDHSKCSINTMLNTGTVIGVSANIFGTGFPPKFIPSFTWGATNEISEYRFDKSCQAISLMMERRSIPFDEIERDLLQHVFQETEIYRKLSKQ